MSQENVEIVRSAFDAWARRDVDTFLSFLDPAVELQPAIIGGAEGNTYRGLEEVREWIAESDAAFEELRVTPEGCQMVRRDGHTLTRRPPPVRGWCPKPVHSPKGVA